MSQDSFLAYGFVLFAAIVLVLAIVEPQLIPIATAVFVYLLLDHVQGMIVGAFLGVIFGLIGKDEKITMYGIPIGAILGIIGQYLLFH